MSLVRFKSVMCPPPGGTFYFEAAGERVEAADWRQMRRLVVPLLARTGDRRTAEAAVAEFMCPDMPSWYCTVGGRKTLLSDEAKANARRYFGMHLVTPAEMARRLSACRSCPKHSRNVCLTCTGHYQWLLAGFAGRRPRLPEDSLSGVCLAAKTFEIAPSSVDGPLPEWDDVPGCCWRRT